MTAYLLPWNPQNHPVGATLDYTVGECVYWPCNDDTAPKAAPKEGDRVYLIRLGKHQHPKGIVASGTVTQNGYIDQKPDNSENAYALPFRLDDTRPTCADGLLPMLLLRTAFPEQCWSPKKPIFAIADIQTEMLEELWHSGRGRHSIEQTLHWLYYGNNWSNSWYQNYGHAVERAQQVKTTNTISDSDLKFFWYQRDNSIASLKQGGISYQEFEQNKDFLKNLTLSILNDPSPENHRRAYRLWHEEGHFQKQNRALINRFFSAADPVHQTSFAATHAFYTVVSFLNRHFQIDITTSDNWSQCNQNLLARVAPLLSDDWDILKRNIALWRLFTAIDALKTRDKKITELHSVNEPPEKPGSNIILYGPPGTGKTYHTVQAAVAAADPMFISTATNRTQLKERYEQLVSEGRIRFVTFHQSFSYEEFVEGLRANSDDGAISYDIESGIFKQICEDARVGNQQQESPLEGALNQFKSQLNDVERIQLKTVRGNEFVVEFHGNKTFHVSPKESTYDRLGKGYPVPIEHIRNLYQGTNTQKIYYPSYVKSILAYLVKEYQLPPFSEVSKTDDTTALPNYVLIIDEINRGNISKIFGELITLIEPSKRAGQPEALSVRLPYSQEEFSVPGNLHIIGTMNTADRSLAMMDTALRRRFDFREMMPNHQLLDDVNVHDVNIGAMLDKMNQRIEYLYDREHTLGHAFFMPLKALTDETKKFIELQAIFKNKVIPLLEEYFFEDRQKVRLILSDNQTNNPELQFIQERNISTQTLFGNNYQDNTLGDENRTYLLNNAAFKNIDAYRKIAR